MVDFPTKLAQNQSEVLQSKALHREEASLEVETISKNALHFANLLLLADDGCVTKTFR